MSSGFILQILEKQKAAFHDRIFSPIVTCYDLLAKMVSRSLRSTVFSSLNIQSAPCGQITMTNFLL